MSDWFTENAPRESVSVKVTYPGIDPPTESSGGQAKDWFAENAPPAEQPDALKRFGAGVYQTTIQPIKDIWNHQQENVKKYGPWLAALVTGYDLAKGIIKGSNNEAVKALKEISQGHIGEFIQHAPGAVPLLGPAAVEASEEMERGNVAGGLGQATGLIGSALLPEAPKAIKAAGKGIGSVAAKVLPKESIVKSTLNSVEREAVDFMRQSEIPVRSSVQTGNQFLRGAEELTAIQPLAAQRASQLARATEQRLTGVANELAKEAYPTPVTPESAGAGVRTALEGKIGNLKMQEDVAYGDAWKAIGDEKFTREVPVKIGKEPILDEKGNPTGQMETKTTLKRVNMPVDVREIKRMLQPEWKSMQWWALQDRSASAGYSAVKNILEGDDFIPAVEAENGLGALKTLARTENPNLRNTSQGIAAQIIPTLQEQIDVAVSETGQGALRGLQQGRALHATKMEIAELAEKIREEPVQSFQQSVWRHDTGIDFLRRINKEIPEELPKIGRAFIQDLFDQATREGGFSKARTLLNRWEELGPETKKLLFRNPHLRADLGKFFMSAEMVSRVRNPSGSGVIASIIPAGILLITEPVSGIAYLLSGYAAGKLLFSPKGISLLTRAMKPSLPGKGALNARQILKLAGKEGVEALRSGPHGPILKQFSDNPLGATYAIQTLRGLKSGEATGALKHPELGAIDLIWGKAGDPKAGYEGGYGLAHIEAKHPGIAEKLPEIVWESKITSQSPTRIQLEDSQHLAKVRLDWDGQAKRWLLTAYEKTKP